MDGPLSAALYEMKKAYRNQVRGRIMQVREWPEVAAVDIPDDQLLALAASAREKWDKQADEPVHVADLLVEAVAPSCWQPVAGHRTNHNSSRT